MPVTVHEVARLVGVSIKTVSNVANNQVHPHTRARVQAAIDQLSYRPNIPARSLRSGRSEVIGLVLPELSLSYFAEFADAVIARAEAHDPVVFVGKTGGDRDRELTVPSTPRMRPTDEVIFCPRGMGQANALLLALDYPLVLLGKRIFDGPVDHVTIRNVEATRAVTTLLIPSGRQRKAVIGTHICEDLGSAGCRPRGYREALMSADIDFDKESVSYSTLWRRADGAESMRGTSGRGVAFNAVFRLNDALGLGAMRALQEGASVFRRMSRSSGSAISRSRSAQFPAGGRSIRDAVVNPGRILIDFDLIVRESS